MAREHKEHDFNLDPITKEPGAHPVGTGLGAAAGGAALGVAAGAVAGPVGAVVGGIVGAVAGGLGGKTAGEAVNPTAHEAYWRDNYTREPYYEAGRSFDDYGPAYRLGLDGYNEYSGDFAGADARLSDAWESRRERSTLSWNEARHASRAAWDRAGTTNTVKADGDVLDVLNDLLETSRNGEYGFRTSAEHVKAQDLKTLLNRRADDCRDAAIELQSLIRQSGGKTDEGGTAAGALHRGWVSVKSVLSGHSDVAILEECERGEDTAIGQYRKALKQELPPAIRAVVERQAQGAQRNHDQVKALRDALRT